VKAFFYWLTHKTPGESEMDEVLRFYCWLWVIGCSIAIAIPLIQMEVMK